MMKRIILSVIAGIAGAWSACAENPADTVARFYCPDSVTVVAGANTLDVKIKGERYGERYVYDYSTEIDSAQQDIWEVNLPFTASQGPRGSRSTLAVGWFDNMYVGAALPVDNAAGIKGGWEIGIDNIVALGWRPVRRGPSFSLGFGMGYRSATVGDGWMLDRRSKILCLVPAGEGVKASSRMHLMRLHIPLMVTQRFCDDFGVRVGAILNFNTFMKATTKAEAGGIQSKRSFDSLHQRFATVDIMGSLFFWDGVGVYARWSPMQVFDKGWGPKFEVLSFGVNFVL